ncbi:MAG: NifB/NifX family molybdenum-iron cluster-binding protein [Sulfurimonadaceae bacterium]|jgi:predicted Fe-Mo cluster-binding NifX family protein|nr:NifB/NifX family molybdenum-iron cluster-binding protein [Sulfurimonadaceae bacterium]
MKIIVPVDSDKSTIVKRTGRAPFYAIYEENIPTKYVENEHGHGDHDHDHDEEDHHHDAEGGNHHRKDVAKLEGCSVILVQAVGGQMKEALEQMNIKMLKLSKYDGETADEVVAKYRANELKSQNK